MKKFPLVSVLLMVGLAEWVGVQSLLQGMLQSRDSDPNLVLLMNWVHHYLGSCSVPTQVIHLKQINK